MRLRYVPLSLGAAAVVAAFAVGCKPADAPKSTALVRYVHAVSNGGPFDFYANNTRDVNGLQFQNATSYFTVDSGQAIAFAVSRINADTPLFTTSENVQGGHTYTFMAADSMSALTPLFISDSNTAPNTKRVKLRVIHAAPSRKLLDVYISPLGQALAVPATLSNMNFEQVSQYDLVPPGSYEVVATAPGNPDSIAAFDTLSGLGSGTVRTIILLDSKTAGQQLNMITVNDVTR